MTPASSFMSQLINMQYSLLLNRAYRHVQKVARGSGDTLKMDGLMVLLKKEVESIDHMTRCIDTFIGSNHTRLVIVVDGLDSCEQDKLLQVPNVNCL